MPFQCANRKSPSQCDVKLYLLEQFSVLECPMASERGYEASGDGGESSKKKQRGSSSAKQCTFDVSNLDQ